MRYHWVNLKDLDGRHLGVSVVIKHLSAFPLHMYSINKTFSSLIHPLYISWSESQNRCAWKAGPEPFLSLNSVFCQCTCFSLCATPPPSALMIWTASWLLYLLSPPCCHWQLLRPPLSFSNFQLGANWFLCSACHCWPIIAEEFKNYIDQSVCHAPSLQFKSHIPSMWAGTYLLSP